MLLPPEKFGLIEPSVYRSAFPTPDSFAHMRLLNLRTVINLSREVLTRAATAFLAEQQVLLVDVGLHVWTHPTCEPISHELIKDAMDYVLNRDHHPLLIVSASGTHQVGALVGCLRRLQGWTISSTLDEYRLYAAPSPRLATEQFIELWDCDLLTLPPDLPAWFERQKAMLDQDRARWRKFNMHGGTGSWRTFSSGSLFSGSDVEGDGTAASTEMATPSARDENIEAPLGPLGADGSMLRVDGPLVLPGTVTSTVDRED